jgi:quercetin dioxygenase-like cupin family protein
MVEKGADVQADVPTDVLVDVIVRADTTPPDDWSGTPFGHLDIRSLVSEARQGSEKVMVGQTVYPPGGTHEHHLHPDAEEVVIVMSGRGWHRVGSDYYDIGPGDIVFIPASTEHSAGCDEGDEPMVILWILGGAPSLEKAGYAAVPAMPRNR